MGALQSKFVTNSRLFPILSFSQLGAMTLVNDIYANYRTSDTGGYDTSEPDDMLIILPASISGFFILLSMAWIWSVLSS